MLDLYQRKIDYMRISITDRCHFQCAYCKNDHPRKLKHQDILSYEQLLLIVDQAIQLGINKFKITGGEPTIRKDYLFFIKELKKREVEVTLTTNGSLFTKKDLDCLSDVSIGRFYKGEKSFIPCTPYSVITLLKRSNVELLGKHVVIIGRSNIVGKPLIQMFLNENSTVTVCHSKTNNLKEITKCADILVVAIGKPKFIDDSYVKEDEIVIDVGTSNVDGQITGDVDFDKVVSKASMISKVPGGVGALTTVLLFKNLCEGLK